LAAADLTGARFAERAGLAFFFAANFLMATFFFMAPPELRFSWQRSSLGDGERSIPAESLVIVPADTRALNFIGRGRPS